ncbi:MAG TPA: divalent-cation tolerance protein CutA [Caulobacteraceae bacterium]|nr:divalent-cation tolerance protein CutA [Caulobacteraceae bacterium]
MTDAIVVSTTAGSKAEAVVIADDILSFGLAACVQITPVDSRYVWKGQVTVAAEVLLLIKTRAALFDQVAERIRALHSYETPEIIATSVTQGSADYLQWLADSTGDAID